jgi:predicted nicotinamide N-methyase
MNWRAVLSQQVPFYNVVRDIRYSLDFQQGLADAIESIHDKLSGSYLEAFLREYFRGATEFDDRLMEYFLRARQLSSHYTLYFHFLDHLVSIISSKNFAELGSTGQYVWDAGIALSEYLVRNKGLVHGKRVIELGSGTGLCGIISNEIGARSVTLTDIAYVLGSTTKKNAPSILDLIELDWRYPDAIDYSEYDVMIASDIIFDPDLVPYLVSIFSKANSLNVKSIISQKVRNPETFQLFHDSLSMNGINIVSSDAPKPHFFYYEHVDIKIMHF